MLGWEFPPHITGGLATACLGLCEGLHAEGVEVCFVVPRARGDEDQRFARVIGANQIWLRRELAPPPNSTRGVDSDGSGGANSSDTESSVRAPNATLASAAQNTVQPPAPHERAPAPVAPRHTFVENDRSDEPLSAYFTAAQYERWLARLAEGERRGAAATSERAEQSFERAHTPLAELNPSREPSSAEPLAHPLPAPALQSPAPAPSAPPRAVCERLEFRGDYGADLFGEVERYARCVAELVATERFDLVHAHDWMTFPAGELAAQRLGVPLVAHVHASEYDRSGDHPDERIRRIEQHGVEVASRVVCVSHYTAGILRTRYHASDERLRVVHNAVTRTEQRERLRTTKSLPEPIVLFLGRVTFQKGPEYFLEAARRVVEVEPNVKFVMVGAGDMLPKMVERAARLGLARHVHFTGFLKGPDVERIYAMADVYVMPSVSEPFGISPLEALALDTPVIVSRQSGVSEVLSNALKVDFWDVDEIANKIVALLRYPALREHVRAAGGDEVRAMSWLDRGRRLREVYGELVS